MFIRTLARWMLASWFVVTGLEAARKPAPHVEQAGPLARQIGKVANVKVDNAMLTNAVKTQGFAMAGAAGMLATGIAPRVAAAALAALTAPTVIANAPVVRSLGKKKAMSPASVEPSDEAADVRRDARAESSSRFISALAMTGAALLAAFDREGKPSIAWRVANPRRDTSAA